jgi:hypothetical protein
MYTGRTKKYAEALIREGENFDYWRWLRQVQEEEAQEKRAAAASNSQGPSASKPNDLGKTAQTPSPPRISPPVLKINNVQISRDQPNTETPKKSLRQRLGDVCNAWDELQETRDRDAVYDYLRPVFAIVKRYRGRRRTRKLLRRAFKFAGLPVDMNANPFAVVIRCTCKQQLDRKLVSKWSRALQYVAWVKKRTPLKTFIKNRGGINACADLYAEHFGRGER